MVDPLLLPRRSFLRKSALIAGASVGAASLVGVTDAPPAVAATASSGDPGDIPVSNVRDFGATGNGVTDDTAAIQTAIQKTSSNGGGIVYLPAGTYAVTGISLAQGVDLIGAGASSATLLFTPASGDVIFLSFVEFMRVSDFQIRFAQQQSSGAAIHIHNCFTINVSHIEVPFQPGKPFGYDGIWVDQSTATFIRDFQLNALTNSGVHISGPGGNDVYLAEGIINLQQTTSGAGVLVEDFPGGAVNITDADILTGKYALLTSNSNYMRFENVYFDSSAEGAMLTSGNALTFSNCWFSNRPGSGLTIGAARGVSVMGGQAINCGAYGIRITDGARYVLLHGVQVIGNNDANVGADGIVVDGAGIDYFSIVGCAVGNDKQVAGLQTVGQQIGIHVTPRVDGADYTITSNVLFANVVRGLMDDGRGGEHYVVGNVGNHSKSKSNGHG